MVAHKLIARESRFLNSCFIHLAWVLKDYGNKFDRKLFSPYLESVLKVYMPYFKGRDELKWDVGYAQKDMVEYSLMTIYKVFRSWGKNIKFWEEYRPRYFSRSVE